MSTTTLSQRLRALASTVHTVELIEPLREMAAMAEAQEAQAGELSDEDGITGLGPVADSMYECGRVAEVMADGHTGFHAVIYPAKGIYHGSGDGYREALDNAYADFKRGDKPHAEYGAKQQESLMEKFIARSRPSQAIGEQTPVAYTMSRDYCALYDLLCEGRDAFCLVDMSFTNPDHVCRDVARVRRRKEWRIDIGARGIGYGDVSPYSENRHATERDALVDECKRMNLEWVAPISPEARDKAIEALESIGRDAREVFDHGTSLLTVKAGTGRIIAVSDQALSALRKPH